MSAVMPVTLIDALLIVIAFSALFALWRWLEPW